MANPILDALETAIESPTVQTALVGAITAGELDLKTLGDNLIANAKGSGVLGLVIAAGKGSVEAEFDAELAKLTPAELATIATNFAVQELKNLGA